MEEERQREFRKGVAEIQALHPALRVLDLLPSFCDAQVCHMERDGRPLLRDVGHLSVAGSLVAGRALAEMLGR